VKLFLDTNVWLSAVVFPGLCTELLLELDAQGHPLLTSDLVRTEVHAVLRRKFARHAAAVTRFDSLWACAAPVQDVAQPTEDADARLVAAALAAGADFFVTGDQGVLEWNPKGPISIVSPRQAWERVVMPRP